MSKVKVLEAELQICSYKLKLAQLEEQAAAMPGRVEETKKNLKTAEERLAALKSE